MSDDNMTYPNYPNNFRPMYSGSIPTSHYERVTLPVRTTEGQEVPQSVSMHCTPMANHQVFECAYGRISYDYSHFPHNCGIGIYSGIGFQSLYGYYDYHITDDQRRQIINNMYREFVHFIRRYSDKDMLLLSDRSGGYIEGMVKASEGQLVPIGEKVKNMNSRNFIELYQTTRIINASHPVTYRKLSSVDVLLYQRTGPEYRELFKKYAPNKESRNDQ